MRCYFDTLQAQNTILLVYSMPNNEGYKIAIKLNYAGKLKIDGQKMKILKKQCDNDTDSQASGFAD